MSNSNVRKEMDKLVLSQDVSKASSNRSLRRKKPKDSTMQVSTTRSLPIACIPWRICQQLQLIVIKLYYRPSPQNPPTDSVIGQELRRGGREPQDCEEVKLYIEFNVHSFRRPLKWCDNVGTCGYAICVMRCGCIVHYLWSRPRGSGELEELYVGENSS